MNIIDIADTLSEKIRTLTQMEKAGDPNFWNPHISMLGEHRCTVLPVPGLAEPSVAAMCVLNYTEYQTELIILIPSKIGSHTPLVRSILNQLETALRSAEARTRIQAEGEDPDRIVKPNGFGSLSVGTHPKNASNDASEAPLWFYAAQGLSSVE